MSDNYIGPLESNRTLKLLGAAFVVIVILFHVMRAVTPSCIPPPDAFAGLTGVPCRVLLSLDGARLGFGNTIAKGKNYCPIALAPACDFADHYGRMILGLD